MASRSRERGWGTGRNRSGGRGWGTGGNSRYGLMGWGAAESCELVTEIGILGTEKAKFLEEGSVLAAEVFQLGEDAV